MVWSSRKLLVVSLWSIGFLICMFQVLKARNLGSLLSLQGLTDQSALQFDPTCWSMAFSDLRHLLYVHQALCDFEYRSLSYAQNHQLRLIYPCLSDEHAHLKDEMTSLFLLGLHRGSYSGQLFKKSLPLLQLIRTPSRLSLILGLIPPNPRVSHVRRLQLLFSSLSQVGDLHQQMIRLW